MMTRLHAMGAGAALLALTALACGDPGTNDRRGYTKAPLEHPTVLIRGEEETPMSEIGEPNRVYAEAIELPDALPAAAAAAGGGADLASVQLPAGVTPDMVEQGQVVFAGAGNCFTCHGAAGAGTPLAPALNDAEWLNVSGEFEEIATVIANGVMQPKVSAVPMPPRGGSAITDEQVRQVAAYVYAISHAGGN